MRRSRCRRGGGPSAFEQAGGISYLYVSCVAKGWTWILDSTLSEACDLFRISVLERSSELSDLTMIPMLRERQGEDMNVYLWMGNCIAMRNRMEQKTHMVSRPRAHARDGQHLTWYVLGYKEITTHSTADPHRLLPSITGEILCECANERHANQ